MENKIGLRLLPFWLGIISLTLSLVYLLARSHSFFGFRVGKHLDLLGASAFGSALVGTLVGALLLKRYPAVSCLRWGVCLCVGALLLSFFGLPL